MHTDRTKIFFFTSLATFLVALGACVFIFHIIENKNEHTSAVINTLSNKMIEKKNTDTLTRKIAEVATARKAIDEYLVDPSHIDVLAGYLEDLGTSTNTTLLVKAADISPTAKNTVVVKISIKGAFVDIMQTIALLENSPYQIHITNAYLNQQTDPDSPDGKQKKALHKALQWQADIICMILTS